MNAGPPLLEVQFVTTEVTSDPPADAPVIATDKVPAPPLSPGVTAAGALGVPNEVKDEELEDGPVPRDVVAATPHV